MNIETSWPRMEVKLRDKGVMLAKNAACFMCSAVRNTQVRISLAYVCAAHFPAFLTPHALIHSMCLVL